VGKPEEKRSLGKPRRKDIEWEGMDWIDLAEDRDQCRAVVNTVTNLRIL
jgi:hypothetical protein